MNVPAVAFGFLLTLSSAFGQTHFISLFNQPLRDQFALSHGELGALYSVATLASAVTLVWVGKWIDHLDLRIYTACVMAGLATAAWLMSWLDSLWLLVLCFYGLRLCGQGLSGHVGLTTVTRYATTRRGLSLSLCGLGFAVGESVMPVLVSLLLTWVAWREIWQGVIWVELLGVLLLGQWLLSRFYPPNTTLDDGASASEQQQGWTRAEVLKDLNFWCIAPAVFTPSILITGLFFHQQSLAAHKGIEFSSWALSISAYSLGSVLMSIPAGVWVDRWGARRVVWGVLLPLCIACLVLAEGKFLGVSVVYFALMGVTMGIAVPSVAVLWVELYGLAHLGAIRALAHALTVFGSALGALAYGVLLDFEMGWRVILLLSALWCFLSSALMMLGLRGAAQRPAQTSINPE